MVRQALPSLSARITLGFFRHTGIAQAVELSSTVAVVGTEVLTSSAQVVAGIGVARLCATVDTTPCAVAQVGGMERRACAGLPQADGFIRPVGAGS
jgi:hypothetical protein